MTWWDFPTKGHLGIYRVRSRIGCGLRPTLWPAGFAARAPPQRVCARLSRYARRRSRSKSRRRGNSWRDTRVGHDATHDVTVSTEQQCGAAITLTFREKAVGGNFAAENFGGSFVKKGEKPEEKELAMTQPELGRRK